MNSSYPASAQDRINTPRSWGVLLLFLAVCTAVAAISGLATAASVAGWYQTLSKPPFNPPSWIFGPVWMVLYIMIAFAGWRIWFCREHQKWRQAMTFYALQLGLNLVWSLLFFGAQTIGLALIEISLLLLSIFATIATFWPIDRPAAWLLLPYAVWVSFASLLNASLWYLN